MAKVQPAQSAKPAQKPSAAPGTVDDGGKKEKKVKKKRALHPSLVGPVDEETGKPTRLKLKEVPADYDRKIHKPLTKRDFENVSDFFEMKAKNCDAQAAKFRQMAKDEAAGLGAANAQARTLIKMVGRMEKLKEVLRAQGLDPEAELAKAMGKA